MKTPAGFGINQISNELNPPELKNPMRRKSPKSVDEIQQMEDAQQVMRYGGKGVGRKLLFGATSAIVGERIAKKVARKYGNKEQQEEAFQTLYGKRKKKGTGGNQQSQNSNEQEQSNAVTTNQMNQTSSSSRGHQRSFDSLKKSIGNKIERVVKAEIKKVIDELKTANENISEVQEVVERIEKRISPRDVSIGSGKEAQTFRFDPLAPEGREVTLVNKAGKSERMASKEGGGQSEYQKVLSKAAYFGAKDLQEKNETESATNKKIKNPAKVTKLNNEETEQLAKSLKEELSEDLSDDLKKVVKKEFEEFIKKVQLPGQQKNQEKEEKRGPENFEEYSKMQDNIEKANTVMRYGGTGIGRKFLFGATSAIVGERISKKIARKFGNKEEQEEAFKILQDPMHGIKNNEETGDVTENSTSPTLEQTNAPQDNNLTEAQKSAIDEKELAVKQEQAEENKEFRELIIKKLDEILEKLEKVGSGGGGMGSALAAGAGALATAASSAATRAALRRGALSAGKFIAGRGIPLVGAGLAGYEVGSYLNEATGASDAIVDAVSSDKSQEEIAAEDAKNAQDAKTKLNNKLKGTGYTALGGGKYRGPDGQVYSRDNLPSDVQQKLGGTVNPQPPQQSAQTPTPQATETATPPQPTPKEQPPVGDLSNENDELKRAQQQQPPVIVAPQQTTVQTAQQQDNKNQVTVIQTRNVEPSVSTYIASIFDHPVVHPGIYKM